MVQKSKNLIVYGLTPKVPLMACTVDTDGGNLRTAGGKLLRKVKTLLMGHFHVTVPVQQQNVF